MCNTQSDETEEFEEVKQIIQLAFQKWKRSSKRWLTDKELAKKSKKELIEAFVSDIKNTLEGVKMSEYDKQVHFFGEMDLDISKSRKEIFDKAFDISECCGYFVENFPHAITLNGREGEKFILSFDGNNVLTDIWDKTRGRNKVYGVINGVALTLLEYPGYLAGF